MSKQGRRIVNLGDVKPYMEKLTGVSFRSLLDELERKDALRNPDVVQTYEQRIIAEMAYRVLIERFQDHLIQGASGSGVQAYGLHQMTEKDEGFSDLKEYEKKIIRDYSREEYVACKRIGREPLFQYNFFYRFDPNSISPATQQKLNRGVVVLKTWAYQHVEKQLEAVRPKDPYHYFDFMSPEDIPKKKMVGTVNVSLNYLDTLFKEYDFIEVIGFAAKTAKQSLLPKSIAKQSEEPPSHGRGLF